MWCLWLRLLSARFEKFIKHWSTGISTKNATENNRHWFEQWFCGRKCLVDIKGQRKIARLVLTASEAAQLKHSLKPWCEIKKKSISEFTRHEILRCSSYNSGKHHCVPRLGTICSFLRFLFLADSGTQYDLLLWLIYTPGERKRNKQSRPQFLRVLFFIWTRTSATIYQNAV